MLESEKKECDKLKMVRAKLISMLEKNPGNLKSILSLADISEEKEDYQEALGWLDKGLKEDPHNIVLGLRKAIILLDEFEDVDSAFSLLKDLSAQFNFLTIEEIKRDWDESIVVEVLLMLVDCYRIKEDFVPALEFSKRAKLISPKDEGAILSLATTHFDMGEFKKSLSLLDPVIAASEDPDFIWQRAHLYCAMGKFAQADEDFAWANRLKAEHHLPFRVPKDRFNELIQTAINEQPQSIAFYIKKIKIESLPILPKTLLEERRGHLSPVAFCIKGPKESKSLIIFQKNIENFSTSEEEIKDLLSSVILHKVQENFLQD